MNCPESSRGTVKLIEFVDGILARWDTFPVLLFAAVGPLNTPPIYMESVAIAFACVIFFVCLCLCGVTKRRVGRQSYVGDVAIADSGSQTLVSRERFS